MSLGLLMSESLIDRRAEAQGLIHDELLRQEAPERSPHIASATIRGVLARRLLTQLEREAESAKAVTAVDLEAARETEWLRYNRPRAVRTVEVFIPVEPMADDRPAHALAVRIHEAVQGASNLEAFAERVRQVPEAAGLDIFRVPPVTEDGRIVPMNPQDREQVAMDPVYAKAATSLLEAGGVSPIVGNSAGYHILYAVEVVPALRPDTEAARDELKKLVLKSRVDALAQALNAQRNTRIEYRHRSPARLIQTIGQSL
jgi:hypothetical protein